MVTRAARGVISAFRVGLWLGWQSQTNWTNPLVFVAYAVLRPLVTVLVLATMFRVAVGTWQGPMLASLVVGAALWPVILEGLQGLAWDAINERDHFRMLAYVYLSPTPMWSYYLGRSFAQMASSVPAALCILLLGPLALGVDLVLRPAYLALALVAGVFSIAAVGLVMVAAALLLPGNEWKLFENLGAVVYLLCGAVFPFTLLPGWLHPVSLALPFTYWLEAMRRALLDGPQTRMLPYLSDVQVLEQLALTTALAIVLGALAFAFSVRWARSRGAFDPQSGM